MPLNLSQYHAFGDSIYGGMDICLTMLCMTAPALPGQFTTFRRLIRPIEWHPDAVVPGARMGLLRPSKPLNVSCMHGGRN
jgi:hypothetical protein